jgi:outer membrane protein assembly factor BamB
VSWDGKEMMLYGYTVEGKYLWKQPLGAHKSQHGAGISPIVHDGKVILTNDDDSAANVLAFEAATGKPLWKVGRESFRACYSTPFILEANGAPELIVASTAGVTSYQPKNGDVNWKYTWKFDNMPLRTVASPIFANGLIVIGSGDGKGDRHLIAIRSSGKGDVSDKNLVWENKKSFPYVPSMLASGDHVYSVNDFGVGFCHEAATGKEVWSKRISKDGVTASPVLIDGKIYVADNIGDVYVFPAAPEYKELARNTLGEPISASPAVSNNRLYLRGKTHLFCIGKK